MFRKLQLSAIILLFVCHTLSAGVFMKQKHHSDAVQMMGQTQPAKDFVETIWITEDGFRSDSEERSMIFDAKKKRMVIADHQNKTYHEMNMGQSPFPAGGEGGEDAAQFQNMMKNMMKMEIDVQPTSERKTIRGWDCKKYILTITMAMGQFNQEIWATETLKVNTSLYEQFSAGMLLSMPGMQQAASQMEAEMKKIKGVQVQNISTNQVMGQTMKSTTELLEFKEGKAPAGLLKIPAGYKKQEMQGM